MNNMQLGKLGEDTVQSYLEQKGYKILCRNYRCRGGEIDIIASKGADLHFIEVKTRNGSLFGHPAESVTKEKKKHIKAAISSYLSQWPGSLWKAAPMQMDVVEVEINHLENV
ncbi:MAG: YraN family protein [Firmicutes bacterium]|nr:YraN family protein [Bacillota bacterium]